MQQEDAGQLNLFTRRRKAPPRKCAVCDQRFYPATRTRATCSARCAATARRDQTYFGGQRNTTLGLREGRCFVCERKPEKGLSAHHVLGKRADPDSEYLVALCKGCHLAVTVLSRIRLGMAAYERLIGLVLRRRGASAA